MKALYRVSLATGGKSLSSPGGKPLARFRKHYVHDEILLLLMRTCPPLVARVVDTVSPPPRSSNPSGRCPETSSRWSSTPQESEKHVATVKYRVISWWTPDHRPWPVRERKTRRTGDTLSLSAKRGLTSARTGEQRTEEPWRRMTNPMLRPPGRLC